jgi:hypothetical protein
LSKVIRAYFDGTDLAEFAMMRLKRDGITVESYRVEPIAQSTGEHHYSTIVFPFGSGYANNAEPLHTEFSRVQPFGGVLYSVEDNTHEQRSLGDDIYSSDVKMMLKVPDNEAEFAEGILRSCHGYKLRVL